MFSPETTNDSCHVIHTQIYIYIDRYFTLYVLITNIQLLRSSYLPYLQAKQKMWAKNIFQNIPLTLLT